MSDDKKIFMVDVEFRFNMAVAASSAEEAESVASKDFEEEMENVRSDVEFYARPLLSCPQDFQGVLPWGVDDKDPRSDWPVERSKRCCALPALPALPATSFGCNSLGSSTR